MKKLVFIVLFSMLGVAIISCKKEKEEPTPIADFSIDTLSVNPGEVRLINKSINASSYGWIVKQNGISIANSSDENPIFKLKSNGKYTFILQAYNSKNTPNIKESEINITNSSFLTAKGPNNPDVSWIGSPITYSKYDGELYIYSGDENRIYIKLPNGYSEGKSYDYLTDTKFYITYKEDVVDYFPKNVCKLTVTKLSDKFIEGTFDFVAEGNGKSFSFTNGKFRVIF